MKFLILTHVEHKLHNGQYFGYGPYVKEMNLWFEFVTEVVVVAPLLPEQTLNPIDLPYIHPSLRFVEVPPINLLTWKSRFQTALHLPGIFLTVFKEMRRADHLHLRCPGNMGLVASFAQIFFPGKKKTAKYAGNWDPSSLQPFSYRLQQKLLSNQALTKNMKVLVYGDWQPNNRNLKPFFTATYFEREIKDTPPRPLLGPLKLIFVGTLSSGKNPLVSCQTVFFLKQQGIDCSLQLYGEGPEREKIERFALDNSLQEVIHLHGNVKADQLKEEYATSHFLLFASSSEGWPKAVAEAMFWGCIPITTRVSCVPEMIGQGSRGVLVEPDPKKMCNEIVNLLQNPDRYNQLSQEAMDWSRQFTMEQFKSEIKKLIQN